MGRPQPVELLGSAHTPDGTLLTLTVRGGEHLILAGGKVLMSSAMRGSEQEMARVGCAHLAEAEDPVVLVGGLGMGYTLRAALDALPEGATVVVAELVPAVVEWNRGPLGPLAREPLADRRTRVRVGDVAEALREVSAYDAVLLDVDNGPTAFTQGSNDSLYGDAGLARLRASLRPGGVAVVWSAWEDRKFEHRLRHAGFAAETLHVRARLKGGGPYHTLFIGRTSAGKAARRPPGRYQD